MVNLIKTAVKNVLNVYPKWKCKREHEKQSFFRFNERPVEYNYVFRKLREIYPRTILDVGTGTTSLPHLMSNCGFLVTAIDNVSDYWPSGIVNRHYHVIDDDITDPDLSDSFQMITCVSVLEHIEDADAAMRNMFSLLEPGGHLLLTFPYNETSFVENVYELERSSYGENAPYITKSFSRNEVDRWIEENGGTIVDQEYWRFWEGEHWTVGEQCIPPKQTTVDDTHQHSCLLIRKD